MTVARRRRALTLWLALGAVAVLAGVVALAGPDGTPDGVATEPDDPAAEPALHASARFSPPSAGVEIEPLAPGDWSLRTAVEYWSDASSSGRSAIVSLAFRVLVAAP